MYRIMKPFIYSKSHLAYNCFSVRLSGLYFTEIIGDDLWHRFNQCVIYQSLNLISLSFSFMFVSSKPEARYIVPSPHWQPSAKDIIHFKCGAFCFNRSMLIAMARLSLFFGRRSEKAIRFNSINSFHCVPSINQINLLLSVLGPYDITPPSNPLKNTPKCSWLFDTTFPL